MTGSPTDPSPDQPLDEVLEVSAPAQLKALAHPLRQRLLFALGRHPATISQLAVALDAQKGNVNHHLKVLREAGLVRVVETRQVRGGTEQYYQRTSRRIQVGGRVPAAIGALLGAVADELSASPEEEPLLTLRHLRLTAAQADRLRTALADAVAQPTDAGDDEPRYGVLVSLYRQAEPGPPRQG